MRRFAGSVLERGVEGDVHPGEGLADRAAGLRVLGDLGELGVVQFAKAAQDAKAGCPVSKALTGVDITLDAALEH